MGADKEIIVALEFGTSAIRGIAGTKKADGTVQILDIEQEKTNDAIQRGVIYNIDKTTQAITNIVERLSANLGVRITRAYVGIGGQSLHSAENTISKSLQAKVKITPELIDNLKDNNCLEKYPASQILDVIPQEYIVGNHTVTEPVGIQCEQIEAHFLNIVARDNLLENVQKCMHMAGIDIAEQYISPLTLAEALLSDNEKRSGCAMVDFGAGTTTVAIYNGNLLNKLVVIPLGGNNVTNDLAAAQQLEFEEAELLKRKHGVAYVAAESDNPQMLPLSNDRTLSENDLQYIIGARQQEIILNAWNQIEPIIGKLLSGIIITGGAAQLKDMPEAIKHFTKYQKVKVAKSLVTLVDVGNGVPPTQGSTIDTLIALLMKGYENCVAPEETETEEEETTPEETHEAEETVVVAETVVTEKKPDTEEQPKAPKGGFFKRLSQLGKKWGEMLTDEE